MPPLNKALRLTIRTQLQLGKRFATSRPPRLREWLPAIPVRRAIVGRSLGSAPGDYWIAVLEPQCSPDYSLLPLEFPSPIHLVCWIVLCLKVEYCEIREDLGIESDIETVDGSAHGGGCDR